NMRDAPGGFLRFSASDEDQQRQPNRSQAAADQSARGHYSRRGLRRTGRGACSLWLRHRSEGDRRGSDSAEKVPPPLKVVGQQFLPRNFSPPLAHFCSILSSKYETVICENVIVSERNRIALVDGRRRASVG